MEKATNETILNKNNRTTLRYDENCNKAQKGKTTFLRVLEKLRLK